MYRSGFGEEARRKAALFQNVQRAGAENQQDDSFAQRHIQGIEEVAAADVHRQLQANQQRVPEGGHQHGQQGVAIDSNMAKFSHGEGGAEGGGGAEKPV